MIKLFLNIFLILISLLACYSEDLYFLFWPPQPQKAIFIAVRTRQFFTFDQGKALSAERKQAHSQYVPVFNYIPESVEQSKKKLDTFVNEFSLSKAQRGRGSEKLVNYLQEELGIQVSQLEIMRLLRYRDLKNLLEGIQTIQDTILQNKIVEDANHLVGKKTVEIQNPDTNGAAVYSTDDIITLEKARFSMQEKIRQLFWQVNPRILDPLLQIALATLMPNLKYNQVENSARLEKIKQQFPSQVIKYEPGDVLVPFKKVLREEDIPLLTSYQKQEHDEFYRNSPWFLFTIFFMVIFYNVFISRIAVTGSGREPSSGVLLFLMVINIIILKGCLLFTRFPIYFLPFGFLPLLAVALDYEKITAVGIVIVGAVLVSLFAGWAYVTLLFFTLGGLAAVLVSFRTQKRLLVLIPALMIGLINAAGVMAFTADWQSVFLQLNSLQKMGMHSLEAFFHSLLIGRMGWAFAGGFVAGPLALLLLPLLELSRQTASTFKLNRHTDLQRPLMKKLLTEARGTYQHSMAVAHLAQSAGEAIGANTLLLRVAAYYHDIGKITNPGYFSENQFDGENPHDILSPQESADLIIDHVRQGMKIGEESGLPKAVVDLILQHHGTHLIEYFYNIASQSNPKSVVAEESYRYPGPKPQSVEAAILMIADAVEAASRSLMEPTRPKFEQMVRLILVKRIVDAQFNECRLTTSAIDRLARALVESLEASFHSRIQYPWQQKVATRQPGTWKIGGIDAKDKEDRTFRL
jgi:putative nucleotidyltransferase with HDIG domain